MLAYGQLLHMYHVWIYSFGETFSIYILVHVYYVLSWESHLK